MMHAFLLAFALCSGTYDGCEEGTVLAQSCAAAEAWVRAGMRDGQELIVLSCEAA
jgi:hypothetical protein